MIRAATILLNDCPSHPVDVVYFFGRSYFDAGKRDLFKVVVDFIKNGRAKVIIIPGSEGQKIGDPTPRLFNPGMTLWTNRLVAMEVPREKTLYRPLPEGQTGFHTKTESDSFLKKSLKKGYTTAVSLIHPHQAVRAMLGLIKTINEQSLPVDVWAGVPQNTNWNVRFKGSQGMVRKPRFMHIQEELNRILAYQSQGDLASFDELFSYLSKRDAANIPLNKIKTE